MAQSTEEIRAILKPWQLVKLTSKGPVQFKGKKGYAGESYADSFEFKEVTNEYEHFSNVSDPPETTVHIIRYEDVISLSKSI
jgi:hypothetical protein